MSPAAGGVAVFGSLNLDLCLEVPALPRPGHTVIATRAQRQFGGKGANQAVAAARQGARVTMVGAIGDDAAGQAYRAHLAREGITLDALATVGGAATGTAHICVDPQGENQIAVDPGANARLTTAALVHALSGAAVLLTQLECPLAETVRALQLASAAGVRTLLNAAPAAADFPWGTLAIDTMIVNEHECRECFAHPPAAMSSWSAPQRRAFFTTHRISHLIVTQGAEPTLFFRPETVTSVPTHPVQPRDTVGAGDTFCGALAAELAAGRDWPAALRYANIAAALSTLAVGAQTAMPLRAEVDAVLR
ncbi:MAG: ribokinase [Opitutaceae bacterium]|nr:ribokinase [Opitutaceae bacterium]